MDKHLAEYFYEGVKISAVKKNWFVRNYNAISSMRFCLVIYFLFNLQYIQPLQVVLSALTIIIFTIETFRNCKKYEFFQNRVVKIVRLIQEVSMSLSVLMIFFFYAENHLPPIFSLKAKVLMVVFFVILLCLNILLEISSAIY